MEHGIHHFHRVAVYNVAMREYAMSLKFDEHQTRKRKKRRKIRKMHVKIMFNIISEKETEKDREKPLGIDFLIK